MEITGISNVRAAFRKLQQAAPEKVQEALVGYAEALLERSQAEVPVQSGTLRDSGRVESMPQEGWVKVIYDAPYAAEVHEDLTRVHPNGGSAKFLERPLMESLDDLQDRLKRAVSEAISEAAQA